MIFKERDQTNNSECPDNKMFQTCTQYFYSDKIDMKFETNTRAEFQKVFENDPKKNNILHMPDGGTNFHACFKEIQKNI